MQSFVAITSEQQTMALITQGVWEYELVGNDLTDLQLTLMRPFGWMDKENLVYRPGRASGEKILAMPDAHLLGKMHFELAALYENATFEQASVAKSAKEYLTLLRQYPLADFLNGRTIFKQNSVLKYSQLAFHALILVIVQWCSVRSKKPKSVRS